MNEELLEKIKVYKRKNIKDTMRKIDKSGLKIAFIVDDEEKLVGVVTDGDIRRAILRGVSLEEPVMNIMNKDPIKLVKGREEDQKSELIRNKDVLNKISPGEAMKMPVVDRNGIIVGIDFLYNINKKFEINVGKNINKKNIKTVLVVGGAGYLGSVLCRKLLEKGYNVKVLDNLLYGDEGIRDLYGNQNFELIKGDMRDIRVVINAIKGVDAVIHLAAIVGDPASALNPEETIEINYFGTKILTEVCKYNQINRFIFASTCSVYGASATPTTRLNEESKLNPVSLYARMKIESERGILELVDENFSPTILRMATLYGLSPRMRFDLAVNLLTAKAVIDKKITIFGGEQWRPFLHVKDAAEAYIKCLEAPIDKIKGEIFNVGSNDQNYQIKEIGKIINQIFPEAKIITDKKNIDKRDYNIDFDKIQSILGFKAKYTIKDAVTEIKDVIENELIKNYSDEKYDNYKFLTRKDLD